MKTIHYPFLKIGLFLTLIFSSSALVAQFNDSLFFNSGYVKAVEIDTFTLARIKYHYINKKGKLVASSSTMGPLKYFRIYDENGVLVFDSKEKYYRGVPGKIQDNLSISRHTLSIAPIPAAFLNLKARYNYTFGESMELGLNARVFYNSPFLGFYDGFGSLTVGLGLKFTPFYNKRYSFGVDFTPSLIINDDDTAPTDFFIFLPLSLDLDFFFTERFGLSVDYGIGPLIRNNFLLFQSRSSLGLLWRFNQKKVIKMPLIYHPLSTYQ